ncbi:hypothetical protein K435DRAFT_513877 [Dendrothele bispora CBS 962.96]|uniref:Uncharacterized protein n=1 Tax=Dendrothele bispora (strain CBS 962.96) TaxID=1314807 RepID=A0A4V4HGI3_DENBC|nr:hypothetical protein K435DRAFT_513877 [Dendrothele bispora CBS 962.96]
MFIYQKKFSTSKASASQCTLGEVLARLIDSLFPPIITITECSTKALQTGSLLSIAYTLPVSGQHSYYLCSAFAKVICSTRAKIVPYYSKTMPLIANAMSYAIDLPVDVGYLVFFLSVSGVISLLFVDHLWIQALLIEYSLLSTK